MTASMNTWSEQQRRALAQMGIDIWVRRGVRASAPAAPSSAPVAAVPVTRDATVAQTTRAGSNPIVALDGLAARGIVIVGELVDPRDRRLAHDIVLAVSGAEASVQSTAFRWPLTQTGDTGIAAARNAYRGFLRGQTERATARWLLLLGPAATALLDADAQEPDAAAGEERMLLAHVLRTLRLPGAGALRADPIAKQRLWLSVSQNDRP